MTADRYTKAVLTVIAGALVALVAEQAVSIGHAQPAGPTQVELCNFSGTRCADIDSLDQLQVHVGRF